MDDPDRAAPNLMILLGQRWIVILVVTVVVTVTGVVYARGLPSKYEAVAVLAVQPKPNSGVGADLLSLASGQFAIVAQSEKTVNAAAKAVGLRPAQVQGSVFATVPPLTANVKITVTLESRTTTAVLANAVAARTAAVESANPLYSVVLIKPATPPTSPSSPHRSLYEFASLFAGLLLGLFAAAALAALRPRVASRNDVEAGTGFPLVGNLRLSKFERLGRSTDASSTGSLAPSFNSLATVVRRQLRAGSEIADNRVLVTSVLRLDDRARSTLVLGVGASLARFGSRVLLIDADVDNRPLLGRVNGAFAAATPGPSGKPSFLVATARRLSELTDRRSDEVREFEDPGAPTDRAGQSDWRAADRRPNRWRAATQVVEDDEPPVPDPDPSDTVMLQPGLALLSLDRTQEIVAEVLAGKATSLDDLSAQYDAVIIDAPPPDSPVTDSFGVLCPAALLMVRRGTSRAVMTGAGQSLRDIDLGVVGVVGINVLGTSGILASESH